MKDTEELSSKPEPITPEMDALALALIDYGLDMLAESGELSVTLAAEDEKGNHTLLSFDDEDFEECIEEAHEILRNAASGSSKIDGLKGKPARYAIAYDGAIDEDGKSGYVPALIVEYGEKGLSRGYSAYLAYENAGDPQRFMCTEPAPAGVCELLV